MASISRSSVRCLRLAGPRPLPSRLSPTSPFTTRFYSAEATSRTPAALADIKSDLKTAMRAKDTPRLTAIRAIMAANLNASKTDSAIETDLQLVALLRRLRRSSEDAAADAKAAKRDDLAAREEEQMRILDEYIAKCGVKTMGKEELQRVIEKAVEEFKAEGKKLVPGPVLGRVLGGLKGLDVDKSMVSQMVKQTLGQE